MKKKFVMVMISLALLSTVVISDMLNETSYANAVDTHSLYIDNEFYGNISNKDRFEKYVEEELVRLNGESKYGKVYLPENYYLEEVSNVYDTHYTEDELFEIFKDKIEFLVDGCKVNVYRAEFDAYNGEEVALDADVDVAENESLTGDGSLIDKSSAFEVLYSTTREEVDLAFERVLETFITRKDLDSIHKGEAPDEFKVGMHETISYNVDGEIYVSEEKVPYKYVETGEELYLSMLFNGQTEAKEYTVKEGDTLEKIAIAHKLNTGELVAGNPSLISHSTIVTPGQVLNVNVVSPVIRIRSSKIIVTEENIPFEVDIEYDDTVYDTVEAKVIQEGEVGKVERIYKFDYVNGQALNQGEIIDETYTSQPRNKIIVKGTKKKKTYTYSYSGSRAHKSTGTASSSFGGIWGPVTRGGVQTSGFGYRWGTMHPAIDIAGLPQGSSILATYDGIVTFAGWSGAGGLEVIIDHENGYVTVYKHHVSLDVKAGQRVVQGQRIGGMGSTGDSTGVHLHFEIYKNGSALNPNNVYSGFRG